MPAFYRRCLMTILADRTAMQYLQYAIDNTVVCMSLSVPSLYDAVVLQLSAPYTDSTAANSPLLAS